MSTKMPLLHNFRENVRRTIDESGESKTDVARRAGIHRVTLHKILAGGLDPSLDLCERLAGALGFSRPEEIFRKTLRVRKNTA